MGAPFEAESLAASATSTATTPAASTPTTTPERGRNTAAPVVKVVDEGERWRLALVLSTHGAFGEDGALGL